MTKAFLDKVIRLGSFDTAKYRYVCVDTADQRVIRRIKIEYLDTIKAYDNANWEVVYRVNAQW